MKIILIFLGILVLGIISSLVSTNLVTHYYKKANKEFASINLTSANLLVYFINKFNLKVKIMKYSYGLNNNYNTKRKIICLSNDIFDNKSVASLAISMHELGHAIQHKESNKLFRSYSFFHFVAKITSFLILPLIILLILFIFLDIFNLKIIIIIFSVIYVINLITRILIIPLEKNASKIALTLLKDYKIFDDEELEIAKKLLSFAWLTYVCGFFNVYIHWFKKIIKSF